MVKKLKYSKNRTARLSDVAADQIDKLREKVLNTTGIELKDSQMVESAINYYFKNKIGKWI